MINHAFNAILLPEDAPLLRSLYTKTSVSSQDTSWHIHYNIALPRLILAPLTVPLALVDSGAYVARGLYRFTVDVIHLEFKSGFHLLLSDLISAVKCLALAVASVAYAVFGLFAGSCVYKCFTPDALIKPKKPELHPSFTSLDDTTTPEMTMSIRRHLEELRNHKPAHSVDAREFALIHGDTFVKDSPLEGGRPERQLEYYLKSLRTPREGHPSLLLPGEGFPEKELVCDLEDSLASVNAMAQGHEEWLQIISKGLKERGRFVMPLIRRGKEGGGGHVFCCVLEKNKSGEIICRLLNKGEGAENHAVLLRGDVNKVSYSYNPITIPSADVFAPNSELGKRLFELLVDYKDQACPDNMPNYTSNEIYQLFMMLGTVDQKVKTPVIEEGITLQRSGTCAEQFVKLLTRDLMLHGKGASSKGTAEEKLKQFKRSVLVKKFDSLHMAYHQAKEMNAIPLNLLMEAAKEFALSVDKNIENGLLTRDDFIKCHALLELIYGMTEELHVSYDAPFPPLQDLYKNVHHQVQWAHSNWHERTNAAKLFFVRYPVIETPEPEKLQEYLHGLGAIVKDYLTFFDQNRRVGNNIHREALIRSLLYGSIRSLPIPSLDQGDYWNQVPADQIENCLSELQQISTFFAKELLGDWQDRTFDDKFSFLVVFQTTALAIADALARRHPEMKMENFALDTDLERISPKLLLPLGHDALRFRQIKDYFAARRRAASYTLFGIRRTKNEQGRYDFIEFEKIVNEYESGGRSTPAAQHLHYLKQFTGRILDEDTAAGKFLRLASSQYVVETYKYSNGHYMFTPDSKICDDKPMPAPYYALEFFAQSTHGLISNTTRHLPACSVIGRKRLMVDAFGKTFPYTRGDSYCYEPEYNSEQDFNGKSLEDKPLEDILFNSQSTSQYKTENELLLQPAGKENQIKHFDPSSYNDLKKILYKSELRIASLAKFCEDQFYLAEKADIKTFIEYAALDRTYLMEKVQREPLTAENLRRVVDAHIAENCHPTHYQDALYWIRLAYHMETHIALGLKAAISDERIEGFHKALDDLYRKVQEAATLQEREAEFKGYAYDILIHQLYIETERQHPSDAQIARILSKWLAVNYIDSTGKRSSDSMHYAIQGMIARLAAPMQQRLEQAPELVQQCLCDIPIPGMWQLTAEGQWCNGDHCTDLIQGKVFFKGCQLKVNPLLDLVSESNKEWAAKLSGIPFNSLVRKRERELSSPDGSFKILLTNAQTQITCQKKLPFTGTDDFYEYYPRASFIPGKLGIDKQCWKAPVKKVVIEPLQGPRDALSDPLEQDKDTEAAEPAGNAEPFYLLEQDGKTLYATGWWDDKTKEVRITRTADGATLLHLDDTPVRKLLAQVSALDNIRAWGQKKDENAFDLTALEIVDLDHLSFKVKDGKAYCEHFSDYYISSQQALKNVGPLKGALILEKEGLEQRTVILPFKTAKGVFPLQGANVEIDPAAPLSGDKSMSFFAYDIDEKTGLLYSDSKEAMLYLALVLKQQGRYSEAAFYLDHLSFTRPLNATAWSIIKMFLAEDNFTPAATALNLKLGTVIVENTKIVLLNQEPGILQQLFIDKSERSSPNSAIISSVESLLEHYIHYLQIRGGREINPVPRILRLTEKQERAFIAFLERFKEKKYFKDKVKALEHWAIVDRKAKLALLHGNKYKKQAVEVQHRLLRAVDHNSDYDSVLDTFFIKRGLREPDAFLQLQSRVSPFFPYVDQLDEKVTPRMNFDKFQRIYPILLKRALEAGKTTSGKTTAFDLDMLTLSQTVKLNGDGDRFRDYHGLLSLLALVRRHPREFEAAILSRVHDEKNLRFLAFTPLATIASSIINTRYGKFFGRSWFGMGYNPTSPPSKPVLYGVPQFFHAESPKKLPGREQVHLNGAQPTSEILFPLESLFHAYMTKAEKEILPSDSAEFALSSAVIGEAKPPLVNRLLDNLKKAHEEHNQHKTYAAYAVKPETTAAVLTGVLIDHIAAKRVRMEELKKSMEALANLDDPEACAPMDPKTRIQALQHRNKVHSGQISRITFETEIIRSVMTRDATFLKQLNPFLTDEQVHEVHRQAIQYMVEGSAVDQSREALKCVEQDQLQDAAKVLGKERRYDPFLYPELMTYEYKTGLMLRTEPDQARLLQRIFALIFDTPQTAESKGELSRLFFEFQAGGGKTKVIAAMIAARTIAEGRLAVFFSLPEIHDITKEDLRQAMFQAFCIKTEELSLTLDTKTTEEDLTRIYKQLKRAWKEGVCFIMPPETFHALHLDFQYSLDHGLAKRVQSLGAILGLFEKHAVFQIDEGHRNVDALLMANVATGAPAPLPEEQREFLLKVYQFLIEDDVDLLDLQHNKQALKNQEEIKHVVERLADFSVKELIVPAAAHVAIRSYLLDKGADAPKWLEMWRTSREVKLRRQAELLFFARGLLQHILPHAFSMVGQMDYGSSIHPGDEVVAPRVQKTATTSKFESPDVAAVLSVQHFRQLGLTTPKHMRDVVRSLLLEVQKERLLMQSADMTPTEKRFLALQKESGDPIALADISVALLEDDRTMLRLIKSIGKESELINRYLRDHVLPQVVVYPNKYTSTASDLSNGATACVHYSATLGAPEQYPYLKGVSSNYWEDTAFLSDVIQRGCLPHNRHTLWLEQKSPAELFEDCYKKDAAMFERLEAVINLGGWSKEFTNEEWAQQFLEFSASKKLDHAGVVFTKEQIDAGSGKVEKVLFILLKSGELKKLKGSNLPKELERLGLKGQRFFKMYGANDTTGTDMVLAQNAKTLVILGEGVTLSSLAQAILRMRGFLNPPIDPDNMQTMLWVGDQKLQEKITAQVDGDTPEHLFMWALYQEAERQGKAILVRAFQEIDFVIRHIIKEEMKTLLDHPDKQIRLFERHKHAFLYALGRDVFSLFGSGVREMDTKEILQAHAEKFAAQANISLTNYPAAQKTIQSVIDQTARIMPKIIQTKGKELSAGMKQNARVEQRQEVKQQQKATSHSRRMPAPIRPYAQQALSLKSARLFETHSEDHRSVNAFTTSDLYSEDLYIMHNAADTIYERGSTSNQRKPIERIMVVSENVRGTIRQRAFIISLDDAVEYLAQLEASKDQNGRKVALFMSNGKLDGRNMTKEELDQLMQGDWFKRIVTDVGLFSGKVRDQEYLKQLASSRPQNLKAAWKEVQESRLVVDPDSVDNAQVQVFLEAEGQQKARVEERSYFDKHYALCN